MTNGRFLIVMMSLVVTAIAASFLIGCSASPPSRSGSNADTLMAGHGAEYQPIGYAGGAFGK